MDSVGKYSVQIDGLEHGNFVTTTYLPNGMEHGEKITYDHNMQVSQIFNKRFGKLWGRQWSFYGEIVMMQSCINGEIYGWCADWGYQTEYRYIIGVDRVTDRIRIVNGVEIYTRYGHVARTSYIGDKKLKEFIFNGNGFIMQRCIYLSKGFIMTRYESCYRGGTRSSELYHPNGRLYVSVNMHSPSQEEVQDGKYVKYYSNGKKCEEGTYRAVAIDNIRSRSLKVGVWKKWSKKQVLILDAEYDDDGNLIKEWKTNNWGKLF
jgi:antitoxin component YwqK of YwqJK toxin-antitoxin module